MFKAFKEDTKEMFSDKTDFKVGDKVTAFGLIGEIKDFCGSGDNYPIYVEWELGDLNRNDRFTLDGKYISYFKEISLKHWIPDPESF
jgi:hypothetical protein